MKNQSSEKLHSVTLNSFHAGRGGFSLPASKGDPAYRQAGKVAPTLLLTIT